MTKTYDISKMTAQEVFEIAAKHLFRQGHRSLNDSSCAYRADNGDMCAVGIFIRAKDYRKKMEGETANGLMEKYGKNNSVKNFIKYADLLDSLQVAHDRAHEYKTDLKNNLICVAKDCNLDYEFLDELSFPDDIESECKAD